jgi:hypothetical protein
MAGHVANSCVSDGTAFCIASARHHFLAQGLVQLMLMIQDITKVIVGMRQFQKYLVLFLFERMNGKQIHPPNWGEKPSKQTNKIDLVDDGIS